MGFEDDFHLDRTLLIKSNKVYSGTLVVSSEEDINMMFNKEETKGTYRWVSFHKRDKHYTSAVSVGKGKLMLSLDGSTTTTLFSRTKKVKRL